MAFQRSCTVTLPFPEAGIRLLPQSSLSTFASTMQTHRERLQEAARELASQYDTIKSEAQRRLGTLFNASDYPTTLDGQPKVFRDFAVENLREFFERFRRLNIRSSPELDALVEQA